MTCTIADGWTALTGVNGVYYREVETSTANQEFAVLKDNQVTVSGDVTKAMLNGLTEATQPTLTFTAYACQYNSSNGTHFDAADAWAKVGA